MDIRKSRNSGFVVYDKGQRVGFLQQLKSGIHKNSWFFRLGSNTSRTCSFVSSPFASQAAAATACIEANSKCSNLVQNIDVPEDDYNVGEQFDTIIFFNQELKRMRKKSLYPLLNKVSSSYKQLDAKLDMQEPDREFGWFSILESTGKTYRLLSTMTNLHIRWHSIA